ncbi:MAG TPA: HDOD domain-containing protein [Thermodesulfovibrionales bacterium]|jgi:putative nucleotidyltransferase with HDIG domain|nr:HDOD domain-containing protein [Thermodesulfovibrionales bacterium]
MESGDVRRFIKGLSDLSTIPGLLSRILSVTRDENSSPDDLYSLISHDQAFAERVIRTANSVLFGHSGNVRDIRQAIMFLGYDRIKSVALGMTVMDIFPFRNSFNIRNLWSHSYEVAFLAAAISDNLCMTNPSECFLSGLLHDIGRIIFYRMNPKKFLDIGISDDLLDREEEIFGCTHADAGAWFAQNTDMPVEIVETIRFHHRPSLASDCKCGLSIVSLAEVLARRFSPRLEDDGIWTEEHDAILLEFELIDEQIASIAGRFCCARPEIERFFDAP